MFLKCLVLAYLPLCAIDTIKFDDGTLYIGEAIDSIANGNGTCTYSDGTVYTGEWKDGKWEGSGTARYPDGDVYVGNFSNHKKEGYGTYMYNNGARYDGQWSNDMFNGSGRLVYADGGRYDGAWKDDLKHGKGKLTRASDNAVFSGYFYNDEFLGVPAENYISKKVPLTDELKEWGFQTEPEELKLTSLTLTYGSSGMMGLSLLVDFSDNVFGGLTLGRNIDPPTWGNRFGMIGWNTNDVQTDGEYFERVYAADLGFRWKKISIGGMAGIGTTVLYENCRVTNDNQWADQYGLTQGDIFHRERQGGYRFAWRAYARYTFLKKSIPCSCFQIGYGNCDGVFAGLGIYI